MHVVIRSIFLKNIEKKSGCGWQSIRLPWQDKNKHSQNRRRKENGSKRIGYIPFGKSEIQSACFNWEGGCCFLSLSNWRISDLALKGRKLERRLSTFQFIFSITLWCLINSITFINIKKRRIKSIFNRCKLRRIFK